MSGAGLSAVVLAGTHQWSGSRFERLAPRPLVPVALEPLISYPLRWLRDGGIRQATICVNGTTRAIEAALGDGDELDIELSYYQDGTPRGAAGCVRDAGMPSASERLVVAGGTAIPTVDFAQLLSSHEASGAAVTAVVHRESPSAAPSPGGLYVFERRVLDHVAPTGFQDIKENLIPKLRRAGERVVAYESGGFCPLVLNASTYLAVNQWVLQRLTQEHEAGVFLHPTARVEAGACLVGPVQLGAGVRIEAGATVVGPTSIGADSMVGRNALVARSVVWSRCVVGERSIVHGCVVGSDAVIPPGTRLFNLVRSRKESQPGPLRVSLWGRAKAAASPTPETGPSFRRRIPGSFQTMANVVEAALRALRTRSRFEKLRGGNYGLQM
jgi:NDP-sugar pyrophosphorylase family protein